MKGNGKLINYLLKKIANFDISKDEKKFISSLQSSFRSLTGDARGAAMRRLREIMAGFYPSIGEVEGAEYRQINRLIKELEKSLKKNSLDSLQFVKEFARLLTNRQC